MKSSLKKLRGFTLQKSDVKERRAHQPHAKLDELVEAAQDMQDMRNCYDSLLSAAAATANSAYEFSEALQEMGTCLLEKTSLNDDEESGRVLLMLGKAHFELQKLVDCYRAHIIQTITTPSESLLKELQIVEEMKRQCDDKREIYKFMLAAQKEKGRSKHAKGEAILSQQLQAAQDDYEEEATLFIFRLKSLKQGQSRSLLTQAARHFAAQLHFFRKGVTTLEVVEPHVKQVTEEQHIDYQFSGLEDNDTEYDDDDYSYSDSDDDELSFDYGQNDHDQDEAPNFRNSMELDQVDVTVTSATTIEQSEAVTERSQPDLPTFSRAPPLGSQSAPIFANMKIDSTDKLKEMRPSSTRKFHTYALPTPSDTKSSAFTGFSQPVSKDGAQNKGGLPPQFWHSSPLQASKYVKDSKEDELPTAGRTTKPQSILKESNTYSGTIRMLGHPSGELSMNPQIETAAKKIKRQAFSGPITGKTWLSKTMISTNDSVPSVEHPPPVISARQTRSPTHPPSVSPQKISPNTTPALIPHPKISELHELPRPPLSTGISSRPSSLIGHSAPLVSRGPEQQARSKMPPVASQTGTPLPTPPMVMARSFSIPSSGQRTSTVSSTKLPEAPRTPNRTHEITSPPLTPIVLSNPQPPATGSESVTPSTKGDGL